MNIGWNELTIIAKPLFDFLSRDNFYQAAYSGPSVGKLIVNDPAVAIDFISDDSGDRFDDWESVTDGSEEFSEDFEWKSWIVHNLRKNNYFDLSMKNFNGADVKLTDSGVCLINELMHRDVKILLNCYANDFFPRIWSEILEVYLNDGFPCGWNGRYPSGDLVVFSNS
ncbi:hypothetical protein ACN9MY_13715 [Pseudoduganella sp. R-31]|uniref:hypothetical protein n=1 Tax=Pseudoduganella sp. R-31 TaxID=3404060 RepID=UPI003CF1C942